jgi:protoporphyrinogen oxidase
LSKEAAYDCLIHFLKNDAKPPPHAYFYEWMLYTFGSGITERYLAPYNRKIWKLDPALMGTEWVDRIPRPPVEDVVKSALGIETEGYTHQLYFFYPKESGIESLPRAFADQVKRRQSLVVDYEVKSIRPTDRGWMVNDEREYRELVSTIPLGHLLRALPEVPSQVRDAALALRSNALRVVLFGVGRREGLDDMTAAYLPDESVLAHRVCFNCAFSPAMAPPGCASLTSEITTTAGDGVYELSDDALTDRVHRDLVSLGILRPNDEIVERVVWREPIAYVVYDTHYAKNQFTILEFLKSKRIHVAGRFGEHKYVNMDACIRRSLDLASELEGPAR